MKNFIKLLRQKTIEKPLFYIPYVCLALAFIFLTFASYGVPLLAMIFNSIIYFILIIALLFSSLYFQKLSTKLVIGTWLPILLVGLFIFNPSASAGSPAALFYIPIIVVAYYLLIISEYYYSATFSKAYLVIFYIILTIFLVNRYYKEIQLHMRYSKIQSAVNLSTITPDVGLRECKSIESKNDRDSCYASIANLFSGSMDIKGCRLIQQYDADSSARCLGNIAKVTKDINLCQESRDLSEGYCVPQFMNACFQNLPQAIAVCDLIPESTRQTSCFSSARLEFGNKSDCANLRDDYQRRSCVASFENQGVDFDYCQSYGGWLKDFE